MSRIKAHVASGGSVPDVRWIACPAAWPIMESKKIDHYGMTVDASGSRYKVAEVIEFALVS